MVNTREFWERSAKAYDRIIGSYSRNRTLIDLHATALENSSFVLDSGSGPGHLTEKLLDRKHRVYSLDINMTSLRLLQSRREYDKNLSIQCGDATRLPYTDNAFDGVSSMSVLWAIEDPGLYLREHRRVLKPKGKLVLSGPGPETKATIQDGTQLDAIRKDLEDQRLFPEIQDSWNQFVEYVKQNMNKTAENWFTQGEITKLLESTGFAVISMRSNPLYLDQGYVTVARVH